MTEQIEHVIKTRLNHLFISCHGKKENMMKRKEATPNAFEDSLSLSFNIKALMTSNPQSAVNPLLIYFCKSLFRCCPEHTYTSCTVCCSWWPIFFSLWHSMATTTYYFIKHYFYCWIQNYILDRTHVCMTVYLSTSPCQHNTPIDKVWLRILKPHITMFMS